TAFDGLHDGLLQLWRDAFIGVHRQHPLLGGQVERAVLLRTEARPVGRFDHVRALLAGDLARPVAAARIEHDDFIGEGDRVETRADVRFFVLGDDDDGKRHARCLRARFHNLNRLKTGAMTGCAATCMRRPTESPVVLRTANRWMWAGFVPARFWPKACVVYRYLNPACWATRT